MSDVLFFKDSNVIPFTAGLIVVDMDDAAERVVVIDRDNISVITVTVRPPTNIYKLVVPQIYTTKNNLIIGILDDTGVYDCKFLDGVKAELVDLNAVDMSQ